MKNTTKKNIKYVDKFIKKKYQDKKNIITMKKKSCLISFLFFSIYISQNESWQRLSKIISIS